MITYYSSIYAMDVPKLKDEEELLPTQPPDTLMYYTESLSNKPTRYSDMGPTAIVPSLEIIQNSLHEDVRNEDKEGVEHLLSQGVFANQVNDKGWTALHIAAACDKPELAELLIARGVDINVKEEIYGATTLHIASACGFSGIVNMLLNNKVLVNAQDRKGNTPLHVASNRAIAENLLHSGASLTIENNDKLAPFFAAAKAGNIDVVRYLLTTKVSLDQVYHNGNKLLHMVASYGATREVVELLIDRCANIDERNKLGSTPLLRAVSNNHREIVEVLIDRGADKEVINRLGETPLLRAVSNNHREMVEVLIDRGANKEARNGPGETPLLCAVSHSHREIVEVLIDRSADKEARNGLGETPLLCAVSHSHREIVEVLIDRSADKEARNGPGETPLLCATKKNHKEIAEILVRHGANIRAKDHSGMPPLTYANKRGWGKDFKRFVKEAEEAKKQLAKEVKEAKKQQKRK